MIPANTDTRFKNTQSDVFYYLKASIYHNLYQLCLAFDGLLSSFLTFDEFLY